MTSEKLGTSIERRKRVYEILRVPGYIWSLAKNGDTVSAVSAPQTRDRRRRIDLPFPTDRYLSRGERHGRCRCSRHSPLGRLPF